MKHDTNILFKFQKNFRYFFSYLFDGVLCTILTILTIGLWIASIWLFVLRILERCDLQSMVIPIIRILSFQGQEIIPPISNYAIGGLVLCFCNFFSSKFNFGCHFFDEDITSIVFVISGVASLLLFVLFLFL